MTAKTKETTPEMKKLTKRQKHKQGPNPSNAWPQQPKIKSMDARDKAYIRMAGLSAKSTSASSSKSSTKKSPLNPNDDIINSPEYKFGRLLASPVARTRHATILKLQEYLKARTDLTKGGLSVLDLMKLWKGLWHTLYLCDGVAVQEEVSKVLSGLIWSVGGTQEEDEYAGRFYLDLDENGIDGDDDDDDVEGEGDGDGDGDEEDFMQIIEMSDEDDDDDSNDSDRNVRGNGEMNHDENGNDEVDSQDDNDDNDVENPAFDEETKHCRGAHLSALFVRTYFRTLTREWSKMDKYRIDKFYTLTRYVLREIYRYMASRHWNLGIIRLFNDAIFEEVLRVQKYGNGVRFHLLDICLDELALVNSEKETGLPLTEATYLDCMEPYFAMAQRVEDNIVHDRVMEKVMSRFLDEYSIVSDNYSSEELNSGEKKKLVMDQVHVQTVAQFLFELASDTETDDRYRKQLYDMHKMYMKRVKAVGRDVIMDDDAADDDIDNDNDNEEDQEVEITANTNEDTNGGTSNDEPEEDKHKNQDEIKHKEEKRKSSSEEKKSKKRKKKESIPRHEEINDLQIISSSTEEEEASKSKKKKKKKKKKALDTSEDSITNKGGDEGNDCEEGEDTIMISAEEQKAAAKASSLKQDEKEKRELKQKSNISKEKRTPHKKAKKVKFDKVNKSKSYKASMKDLKNLDTKATLSRTPEKSILLKRNNRK
jgi:hypothetical protein